MHFRFLFAHSSKTALQAPKKHRFLEISGAARANRQAGGLGIQLGADLCALGFLLLPARTLTEQA